MKPIRSAVMKLSNFAGQKLNRLSTFQMVFVNGSIGASAVLSQSQLFYQTQPTDIIDFSVAAFSHLNICNFLGFFLVNAYLSQKEVDA